jgi:hypothetical protein
VERRAISHPLRLDRRVQGVAPREFARKSSDFSSFLNKVFLQSSAQESGEPAAVFAVFGFLFPGAP